MSPPPPIGNLRSDRFQRAVLKEIAFGSLSAKAIDWYLATYFAALPRDWILQGCARAVAYGPSIEAEQIFQKIITTQREKAGTP